jgi:hypothetical protein
MAHVNMSSAAIIKNSKADELKSSALLFCTNAMELIQY